MNKTSQLRISTQFVSAPYQRYWITPPALYKQLNDEFNFDFDPCPCPRPNDFNGLIVPWGKSNYVNPPFKKCDAPYGGPTAFARKAIVEHLKGNHSVLVLPVYSYIDMLLSAGAEIRPLGRVPWSEVDLGTCRKKGPTCCAFILK